MHATASWARSRQFLARAEPPLASRLLTPKTSIASSLSPLVSCIAPVFASLMPCIPALFSALDAPLTRGRSPLSDRVIKFRMWSGLDEGPLQIRRTR